MTIVREILDPKLAKALEEITKILDRHAIAGTVVVASSTHTAFKMHLPKWSCIQFRDDGAGVHIKMRSKDGERPAASLHLLLSLRDVMLRQAMLWHDKVEEIVQSLRDHGVEIEHKPFGGPDEPADNH